MQLSTALKPVLYALTEVTTLAGAALAPLPPGSPMRMPPAPRSVRAQCSMRLLTQPARNQMPYSPVWAISQSRKMMLPEYLRPHLIVALSFQTLTARLRSHVPRLVQTHSKK